MANHHLAELRSRRTEVTTWPNIFALITLFLMGCGPEPSQNEAPPSQPSPQETPPTSSTPSVSTPPPPPEPSVMDRQLATFDAIIAQANGSREPSKDTFCATEVPTQYPKKHPLRVELQARQFICEQPQKVQSWTIRGEHKPTQFTKAQLTLRVLDSKSDMQTIRQKAKNRFGKGRTTFTDGGISWCYSMVVWHEAHLWTLSYPCGSGKYVKWVQEVQRQLFHSGEPDEGVVGIMGTHGGWTWLVNEKSERVILSGPKTSSESQ